MSAAEPAAAVARARRRPKPQSKPRKRRRPTADSPCEWCGVRYGDHKLTLGKWPRIIRRCESGKPYRLERIRKPEPQRSTPQSFTDGQSALLGAIFRRLRDAPELRALVDHPEYLGLRAKVRSIERRATQLRLRNAS